MMIYYMAVCGLPLYMQHEESQGGAAGGHAVRKDRDARLKIIVITFRCRDVATIRRRYLSMSGKIHEYDTIRYPPELKR